MSVKLAGSKTWSFHGISCLPLNFRRFLQFTLNLKLVLKLTGNVFLFARNQKFFQAISLWSLKEHGRFRISDPLNNTGLDSEFLIPQITQERIRNFWFLNNTGEDSEFLIPQTTPERIQNLIPQTPKERIQNFRSTKQKYNTGRFSIFRNP